MTYQALVTLPPEDQDKLARGVVKEAKDTDATVKRYKSSFPAAGKLVCALEERLNKGKANHTIAANLSLASYWESITKAKLNNHAMSCAVAFGTYVRTGLIQEADYDKNTSQCLELAASISTACGGEVTHDLVGKAAEELKDRSKDSAKNLKAILDDLKERKTMSEEAARKAISRLMEDGYITTVISAVGAEIVHLEDTSIAKSCFLGIQTVVDMFSSNTNLATKERRFPKEILMAWFQEHQSAKKPLGSTSPAQAPTTAGASK